MREVLVTGRPVTEPGFTTAAADGRRDRGEVFLEYTKSICPVRKVVVDAQAYLVAARFNKPGKIPLAFQTEVKDGCPSDCGLSPEHKQHACLEIIEVNTGCNPDCPVCFADSGHQPDGYSITTEQQPTEERLRAAAEALDCAGACGVNLPEAIANLTDRAFMIVVQDFQDPYTLNVRQLMKCCVEEITPEGKLIPFCAYNSVGYREQVREQMSGVPVAGVVPNATPLQPLLVTSPHGSKTAGDGNGRAAADATGAGRPAVTR
jgi:uncharacterized radical SAM superfamily Fe-S cluster-containing enzyme